MTEAPKGSVLVVGVGASQGLGAAIARRFAAGGHPVVVAGRNAEKLEVTAAELKASLLALSWHRLRHTWAELAALSLYRKRAEGGWAILKEWGGWRSEDSMRRYVENAKRLISFEAAREYLTSYKQE